MINENNDEEGGMKAGQPGKIVKAKRGADSQKEAGQKLKKKKSHGLTNNNLMSIGVVDNF